jgi:hypothetical protein
MVYSQPYVVHWEMNNFVLRASFMHPDRKVISQSLKELTKLEYEQIKLGAAGYLEFSIRGVYETLDLHISERFPELRDIVFPPNSSYRKHCAAKEEIEERGWVGG